MFVRWQIASTVQKVRQQFGEMEDCIPETLKIGSWANTTQKNAHKRTYHQQQQRLNLCRRRKWFKTNLLTTCTRFKMSQINENQLSHTQHRRGYADFVITVISVKPIQICYDSVDWPRVCGIALAHNATAKIIGFSLCHFSLLVQLSALETTHHRFAFPEYLKPSSYRVSQSTLLSHCKFDLMYDWQ